MIKFFFRTSNPLSVFESSEKKDIMRYFIVVFGLPLLLGCEQDAAPQPSGKYVGTFQRGTGGSLPVVLTFTGNDFVGGVSGGLALGSGIPLGIPHICRGTFTLNGNTINFQNTCAFAANIDASLILASDWQIKASGNRLTLTRNQDRYDLAQHP